MEEKKMDQKEEILKSIVARVESEEGLNDDLKSVLKSASIGELAILSGLFKEPQQIE